MKLISSSEYQPRLNALRKTKISEGGGFRPFDHCTDFRNRDRHPCLLLTKLHRSPMEAACTNTSRPFLPSGPNLQERSTSGRELQRLEQSWDSLITKVKHAGGTSAH
ncbi:hypothetical protein CEXT_145201 [Caerostris extrusa]|uniref:Uncharacterized protein n=1 Tax=Caerostris extrusa TaxID=172846 RepID=A0AAV4PTF7_CAEEX|nr:hypothetical protein CEXT_145201 [Caerostris extrusa]